MMASNVTVGERFVRALTRRCSSAQALKLKCRATSDRGGKCNNYDDICSLSVHDQFHFIPVYDEISFVHVYDQIYFVHVYDQIYFVHVYDQIYFVHVYDVGEFPLER
jgi:hypothetical protein